MNRATGKVLGLAAVLAVAAGAISLVWGDVATPRPRWTMVRMESETVNITLGEKKVAVEAVFHMYNEGNEAPVKMGYPLGVFEEALNDFAVQVDDKPVKDVRTEKSGAAGGGGEALYGGGGGGRGPGGGKAGPEAEPYRFEGPYKEWKTWTVPMKSNQPAVVKVTYWVKPASIQDRDKGSLLFYAYTLKTGATWKGKINEAVVRLALDGVKGEQVVRRSPAGYELAKDGKTTWTMKDFKPTDDIEITYKPAAPAAAWER